MKFIGEKPVEGVVKPMKFVIFLLVVGVIACFATTANKRVIVEPVTLAPTQYTSWAHKHWIWLHNSEANQQNITTLANEYLSRGIPVGAVNLDSTWETQFNNFVLNTEKYPDAKAMVDSFHAMNVKVIYWITSMVNDDTDDWDVAVKNHYLVTNKNGEVRPLQWWHGSGGLLDYTNPEALDWWHKKMDLLLVDVGIDGWKVDGVDPYILEYNLAGGAYNYKGEVISNREYADLYYGDYFDYTRTKRGVDGLIMSRPVDCMVDQVAEVCWGYSPKRVVYSGWVGDDDSSWNGLRNCMKKVIYSAWDGYANFACDTGGYREQEGNEKELFVRWTQYSAFLPLMENGGGGEHRPWMYDDETVTIYKRFVKAHHSLVPYLLRVGSIAMESGTSSIIPVAKPESDDKKYKYKQPNTFAYYLGPDIFVHPIVADLNDNKTQINLVNLKFPEDSSTTWLDWWQPHALDQAYHGGDKDVKLYPLLSYPVFVRRNALIPMHSNIRNEENSGSDDADDKLMFTWFAPLVNTQVTSEYREPVSEGTGVLATAKFASSDITLTISSAPGKKGGFKLIGISSPEDVDIKSNIGALCAHYYFDRENTLSVLCQDLEGGIIVDIKSVSQL